MLSMIQVTQGLIKVRSDRPGLRLWWSLWGLLLLGVILTLLLVWQQRLYGQSATDGIMMPLPGCGPGQPCEAVLTSPYGRVLGKPLSYWGLAFYGLVAVTLLISAFAWQLPIAPPFSLMLPVVTSIGFTAAVWTSGVMFFVLGQFCGYCVALHVVNVALFGVSIEYAREDWRIRQRRRWEVALPPFPSTPVAVHVFLGLLVATTQVLAMSMFHGRVTTAKRLTLGPTTLGVRKLAAQPLKLLSLDDGAAAGADGEPESDGDGRPETIWTILGSRDAPYRLVVYSCPTCPTCAALHKVLSEIVARYPQQLRVDVRFWPLWHTCNDAVPKGSVSDRHRAACDLVRYALAVAAVDPEAFPGYLDWLYGRAADVNEPLAETEARVRVDQEAFDKARDSVAVWQRFNDDIELGYRLGLTSVPQLFLEQGQVYGGVTVENLDQLLTRLYGFPPVAGQGVNLRPVWLDPDYLQKKAKDTEDLRARGLY
ncbi:MAG: thioredoxin domain-containing protein, partial [Planctomycetales bacterium]|nr:thioredoxin domain-containing protein [Planctomycetales bacterium]NIP68499.1 thioredoxin domain-containing protein [Planctomycetales bacterium]